eukprot:scaffold153823_cov20-Prasinocladus_malaysianus.AAC.2
MEAKPIRQCVAHRRYGTQCRDHLPGINGLLRPKQYAPFEPRCCWLLVVPQTLYVAQQQIAQPHFNTTLNDSHIIFLTCSAEAVEVLNTGRNKLTSQVAEVPPMSLKGLHKLWFPYSRRHQQSRQGLSPLVGWPRKLLVVFSQSTLISNAPRQPVHPSRCIVPRIHHGWSRK